MVAEEPQAELTRRLVDWRPDHIGTLTFLHQHGRVLLMRKKRGHGAGKINGPGGKLESGETPLACAVRETLEEIGVRVLDATLKARFRFVDRRAPQWYGYVFTATRFAGEPRETEEGLPAWYSIDALPVAEMWEDDRYWLPRVLGGEKLTGDFLFDDGHLLAHRLSTLEEGAGPCA